MEAKGKVMRNDCMDFIAVLYYILVSRGVARVAQQSGETWEHWPFSCEHLWCSWASRPSSHRQRKLQLQENWGNFIWHLVIIKAEPLTTVLFCISSFSPHINLAFTYTAWLKWQWVFLLTLKSQPIPECVSWLFSMNFISSVTASLSFWRSRFIVFYLNPQNSQKDQKRENQARSFGLLLLVIWTV